MRRLEGPGIDLAAYLDQSWRYRLEGRRCGRCGVGVLPDRSFCLDCERPGLAIFADMSQIRTVKTGKPMLLVSL